MKLIKLMCTIIFFLLLSSCLGGLQEDIEESDQVAYLSYSRQTSEADRQLFLRPVIIIQNVDNSDIYEGLLGEPILSEFHAFLSGIGVRDDGRFYYVWIGSSPLTGQDGVRIYNNENVLQLNMNESRVLQDAISECDFSESMRNRIERRLMGQSNINSEDIQRIFFDLTRDVPIHPINPVGWSGTEEFTLKIEPSYRVRIRLNNGENYILSNAFSVGEVFLTYDISDRFSTACSMAEPTTTPGLTPLRSSRVVFQSGRADRIIIGNRFLYEVSLDRSVNNLIPLSSPGFGTRFFGPFRKSASED